MNATTENTQSTPTYDRPARPELRRSSSDRMLAGVAGGLARYLDVDATLVRIAFVVLTVVGGAGVPLYLASWLLIPEDGADQSIAASFLDSRRNR
ncbi:MAG TPA: PspC domain-containing protein [Streptosporangiaceae bacterium]|jgi:phage shock protein PspC (stress-responsive transcriptional regulator)